MEGQTLKAHLKDLQQQLTTLLSCYENFKSRTKRGKGKNLSIVRHVLNLAIIILIIISITYVTGFLLVEAKTLTLYIGAFQIALAIALYLWFIKKMYGNSKKVLEQTKGLSQLSVYELDQLRFQILQNIATSPISQNYITPTSVRRMLQYVDSGSCSTIEVCMAKFNKERNKKHEEELKLISYLQTTSFY